MKKTIVLALAFLVASVGLFAQSKPAQKDTTHHKVYYTCPMHPDVVSDNPGKCPKCGMTLVERSKKEQMKMEVMKTYTCPMHPDVVSDKPGKCPKCGMTLVEKKPTGHKMKKDSTMKM